jgi:hypothetical protein
MSQLATPTVVTFFPRRRDPTSLSRPERGRESGDDGTYVTVDVANRDRREAERLVMIGFLHVGV